MTKIGVSGACGRMGRRIIALSGGDDELEVSGALEAENCPHLGKQLSEVTGVAGLEAVELSSNIADIIDGVDVLIDFSSPEAALGYLEAVKGAQKTMVIGTTGFSREQLDVINSAAGQIAVVMAPNMSLGVNVFFALVEKAAELLGQGYDMEIIEAHHNLKKDAPSGTAKKLADILAKARDLEPDVSAVYGREGLSGPRSGDEIGIHAVRGGDIVGEHTVMFVGTGERVELVHRAQSRDTFAYGALQAAKFIAGKPAGIYDMQNVLGLK